MLAIRVSRAADSAPVVDQDVREVDPVLARNDAHQLPLDLARTEVVLAGVPVFRAGASAGPEARAKAQDALRSKEIEVAVTLGRGKGQATIWTCDLSYDYVRINAEYRT